MSRDIRWGRSAPHSPRGPGRRLVPRRRGTAPYAVLVLVLAGCARPAPPRPVEPVLEPPDFVRIDYSGVARSVTSRILEIVPHEKGRLPRLNGAPPRLRLSFDSESPRPYPDPSERQLLIWPVEAFRRLFPEADRAEADALLATLRALIGSGGEKRAGPIPVLPALEGEEAFASQVHVVPFEGGSGLAFLTGRTARAGVFYTFQGLTDDGAYHVALFAPVEAQGASVATSSIGGLPSSLLKLDALVRSLRVSP